MDLSEVRYIAEGFRSDLENILKEYQDLQTYDFEEFTKVWKKRNFSLVFIGRENEKELAEFTQEAFLITLGYVERKHPYHRRAAAVYVLYGLYIKQPLDPKCKIRVVMEQWKELMELYEYSKTSEESHLLFIILKMCSLRCFDFVAESILKGPKSTMTWDLVAENTESCGPSVINVIDGGKCERLSDLHNDYEKNMEILSKKYSMDRKCQENIHMSIKEDFQNLIDRGASNSQQAASTSRIQLMKEFKKRLHEAESVRRVDIRRKQLLKGNDSESDPDEVSYSLSQMDLESPSTSTGATSKKSCFKKKNTKKIDKKRGRPKKGDIKEEEDSPVELAENPVVEATTKGKERKTKGKKTQRVKQLDEQSD